MCEKILSFGVLAEDFTAGVLSLVNFLGVSRWHVLRHCEILFVFFTGVERSFDREGAVQRIDCGLLYSRLAETRLDQQGSGRRLSVGQIAHRSRSVDGRLLGHHQSLGRIASGVSATQLGEFGRVVVLFVRVVRPALFVESLNDPLVRRSRCQETRESKFPSLRSLSCASQKKTINKTDVMKTKNKLTGRHVVTHVFDEEFDNVAAALLNFRGQERGPVGHGGRVGLEVVLPLADRRHHVGPLFFQQSFLSLGGDVERLERFRRQMGVAEQGAVEVVRMLPQVRLLGAVELLPGGLRGRHVTRHVPFDHGASLDGFLHPPDALLQRNGGRLQQSGAGRLQLAANLFALVDEIRGRRLDHVVEIAPLLLRLLDGRRHFAVRVVHAALKVLASLLHRIDQIDDHLQLLVALGVKFAQRLARQRLLLVDAAQLGIRLLVPLDGHLPQPVHSVLLLRQQHVDQFRLLL